MDRAKFTGKSVQPGLFKLSEPLVLKSKQDYEVSYLTNWLAVFTGGGKAILPKDEKIMIEHYAADAPAVPCVPVDYDRLHPIIVPEKVRSTPKYAGYYFVIPLDDLDDYFDEIA